MSIRDLIPWNRNRKSVPVRNVENKESIHALQCGVNDLFDNFWGNFNLAPFSDSALHHWGFSPSVEVKESSEQIAVTAELPGLTEKDVEVVLVDGNLTLKGEKKEEKKEEKAGVMYSECTYGSFHRTIPLNCEIEQQKVKAEFRNGVLTVTLPKTAKARAKAKHIEVKRG